MKFSPRPLVGLICLLALGPATCVLSSAPTWLMAEENDLPPLLGSEHYEDGVDVEALEEEAEEDTQDEFEDSGDRRRELGLEGYADEGDEDAEFGDDAWHEEDADEADSEFDEESEFEEEDDWDEESEWEEEFEADEEEYWDHEMDIEARECAALEARIRQLVEVSSNESLTAAYVLERFVDAAEPEEALQLLSDALERTADPALKRMLQIKLLELHQELEQPRAALNLVRSLLANQ